MITQNPQFDRRRQLAMALLSKGINAQPPQQGNMHWSSGLANALAGFAGARGLRSVNKDESAYKQSALDTIRSALNPDPVQVGEEHGPTQAPKTDRYSHLIQTLAGNPATAETALKAQLSDKLNPQSMPSNLAEWAAYQKMTPEEKEAYLTMKRADKWLDTGPSYKRPSPVTGTPTGTVEKGLPPQETPGHKSDVAAATAAGKAEGERRASAPAVVSNIDDALALTDELLNDPGTEKIFGAVEGRTPNIRQKSRDLAAVRTQLVGKLKLNEREKLKGQGTISDFEARMLGDAVTLLNDATISDERAIIEIQKIKDILSGAKARASQYIEEDGWSINEVPD